MIKVGDVIGRWTIVSERYIVNRQAVMDAVCSCGKAKVVRYSSLQSGDSKSCGCLAKECARKRMSTKQGESTHYLHQRWYDMNRRCLDSRRKDYNHYGGRGITVCQDWHKDNPQGFQNFLKDMESTYQDKLEIDRIDNNGDYCKDNCKWSTRSEQMLNVRDLGHTPNQHTSTWLDDGEEVLHLAAMAKKHNISPRILSDRLGKLGYSLTEALRIPVKVKGYFIEYNGVTYTPNDIFKTQLGSRIRKLKVESTGALLRSIFNDCVKIKKQTQGEVVEIFNDVEIEDSSPYKITSEKFQTLFKPSILLEVIE